MKTGLANDVVATYSAELKELARAFELGGEPAGVSFAGYLSDRTLHDLSSEISRAARLLDSVWSKLEDERYYE